MKTITIQGHQLVTLEQAYRMETNSIAYALRISGRQEMLRARFQARLRWRKQRHR